MRLAIISDVHSNIEALVAVLRHAENIGHAEGSVCLGDIVGYGADPGAVIERLRAAHTVSVAGNHDRAAVGLMGVEEFNPVAAEAALWQAERLTPDEAGYLRGLPLTRVLADLTLVHGSLRAPEWEYLLDAEAAEAQFVRQRTPISLIGHSHLQFYIRENGESPRFEAVEDGQTVEAGEERLIINPGSVGQPRDGDPRAGYILYDEAAATLTWHRVEYDIVAAQRKIVAAGLDAWLAERLAIGR
jgi:diadenosine tetraphosphatase ApaH/serine/threonine PP2A family protein phosphatase